MQVSYKITLTNGLLTEESAAGVRVPNFVDRITLRRLERLSEAMISGSNLHHSKSHWPILANFSRDRSMSYFVACVRTRNMLSKYLPPHLDLAEYFLGRIRKLLGIQARLAHCPTFGPLFAVNATRIHENPFCISHYIPALIEGWAPIKCPRVWKLVVPIDTGDDAGSIATYRTNKVICSDDDLAGVEVHHHFLESGVLFAFDAKYPHEQIPGTAENIFLECYLGQIGESNQYLIWS